MVVLGGREFLMSEVLLYSLSSNLNRVQSLLIKAILSLGFPCLAFEIPRVFLVQNGLKLVLGGGLRLRVVG